MLVTNDIRKELYNTLKSLDITIYSAVTTDIAEQKYIYIGEITDLNPVIRQGCEQNDLTVVIEVVKIFVNAGSWIEVDDIASDVDTLILERADVVAREASNQLEEALPDTRNKLRRVLRYRILQ